MTDKENGASVEAADDAPAPLSAEDEAVLESGDFTEEEIAQLRGESTSEGAERGVGEGEGGAEEASGADNDEPPAQKTVPLAALHEARSEVKELREKIAQFETFQRTIAERIIQQRTAQEAEAAQRQQDEIPDENSQPIETIAWLKKELQAEREARIQRETQQREHYEAQQRAAQENQAIVDRADSVLNEAIKTDPSVADAFQFASKAIAEELQRKGYQGQQLQIAFNNAVLAYARTAPTDPAEMREYAYRNARYWGWTPQTPQQKADTAKPDPMKQIDQLQKGMNAAKTLSGGGAGGGGELTLEDLAGMSGAELEKLASDNPDLFEKITGLK